MKKRGLVWTGVLLILAALFLTIYNVWDADRAGKAALNVLQKIKIEQDNRENQENIRRNNTLYERYPEMTMPTIKIDGKGYIGIVRISNLNLELPILETCNESYLQTAPCRYSGSVYSGDLIIAGHNYYSHFGNLENMSIGNEIQFQDVDQNLFYYNIVEFESIPGDEKDLMVAGEWDLTLFTCDYSGKNRIAVRCQKIE